MIGMQLILLVVVLFTFNIFALVFVSRLAYRYKYLDHMTQLYNKKYLEKIVKKWLMQKKDFTVCFFDIDKFKMLNDTYGHLAGDSGIVHLSNMLYKSFKKRGIAARVGGDEFAVVFLGHSGANYGTVLEDLKQQSYNYNGRLINFSVSIGVCNSNAGLSYSMLMEMADENLYSNKKINSIPICEL